MVCFSAFLSPAPLFLRLLLLFPPPLSHPRPPSFAPSHTPLLPPPLPLPPLPPIPLPLPLPLPHAHPLLLLLVTHLFTTLMIWTHLWITPSDVMSGMLLWAAAVGSQQARSRSSGAYEIRST